MGIYILTFLILVAAIIPYLYATYQSYPTANFTLLNRQLDSLKIHPEAIRDNRFQPDNFSHKQQSFNSTEKINLFDFDPNTIDSKGWKTLGLTEKNIHTIENYITKGGKFYRADDLKKIWGIRPDKIESLIPFVKIQTEYSKKEKFEKKINRQPPLIFVDVNKSDSADWESLPGIGPKLAQRIILFREKLGGFYSIDQVAETFGLQDSVFQKCKNRLAFSNIPFQLININTADVNQLAKHPYIRFKIANALIQYRNQHGFFQSVSELKKVILLNDSILAKVSPYLTTK